MCKCDFILPELPAGMKETLKESTKQVMIRLSSVQWREGRTRGHVGSLNLESTECQTVEHRKTIIRLCRKLDKRRDVTVSTCKKTAHARNNGELGPNCKWTTEDPQSHAAAKAGAIRTSMAHCSDHSGRIRHDTHAPTSRTWTSSPRSRGL